MRNCLKKVMMLRLAILLFIFTFVFSGNYFGSTLSTVDAVSNDHVKQVKQISALIREKGEKSTDRYKNKYYIEWDLMDSHGAEIYRKSPTKLGFFYYYFNQNGVLFQVEADLTGKTKTMKYKITLMALSDVSDDQERVPTSVTTAAIKDISKYRGNTSGIVVNDSDLDSFISDMSQKEIKELANEIIDSSLKEMNIALYFNQEDEEEQLTLYDLGFSKKYKNSGVVENQ